MLDRMNLKKALNRTLECDPTTLVSGGDYKTQNGLFTYTIESMTVTETEEALFTWAYNGSPFDTCTISSIYASTDYSLSRAQAEGTINCTLPGSIGLIANFKNDMPFRSGRSARAFLLPRPDLRPYVGRSSDLHTLERTTAKRMAQSAGQLVERFAEDVSDDFSAVLTAYRNISSLCRYSGSWSSINDAPKRTCSNSTTNDTITVERRLHNFVQVLWSAVLYDLGVDVPYSVLTNTEVMRTKLRTNFDEYKGTTVDWPDSHAVDQVLANLTGYGLPLYAPQPASLSARYICRRMVWKQPTNLAIDVLVATASLFMAYWGILNFVLSSVATRFSPSGKPINSL
ncbi:hypothetical protein BDV93DRAFT_563365 [Ceratobasidium sp. AG-I]|nr:hypothetical protein BDV93DRAFT_563365 [Ceratobasidium sp. AG-I]